MNKLLQIYLYGIQPIILKAFYVTCNPPAKKANRLHKVYVENKQNMLEAALNNPASNIVGSW